MSVRWLWAGAVTHGSFWVRGQVEGSLVRLVVSEHDSLTSPTYFGPVGTTANIASLRATGLDPDTQYHYAFEVDGQLHTDWQGKARTFPVPGEPASYTFWSGHCAGNDSTQPWTFNGMSNHPIFDNIRQHQPLFGIHSGDLWYRDSLGTDLGDYRLCYSDLLTYNQNENADARQGLLYRNVPVAWVWDDHDSYGGNNSHPGQEGRQQAAQVFRERAPHYPLPADTRDGGDGEVYQTFVCGRQRFILLDVRSKRSDHTDADGPEKTMLGADQKQWLKDTLLAAQEPVICVATIVPWGGPPATVDHWAGFSHEREDIGEFIDANDLTDRIWLLGGDMHGSAADSGANHGFGGASMPHAFGGALDCTTSTKGGPYDLHSSQQRNAYAMWSVTDNGTAGIDLNLSLRRWVDDAE